MITILLSLLAQSAASAVPAARVMACYMQEDNLGQRDPGNPNAAHLVGPKYLIAWKYVPLATFGISRAPMKVHDPHRFLNGNSFGEQNYNSEGMAFFAGEPAKELFTIGVMPDQTPAGLHKAQLIHTSNKKVVGMAFGYCMPDERPADEAFAFWKSQSETLP
jgi:hypothetical protein